MNFQNWNEVTIKVRVLLESKGHILGLPEVEITEEYYRRWAPTKIGRTKKEDEDVKPQNKPKKPEIISPTKAEMLTELGILLLTNAGPSESQIAHREGRVRSLVWALSGKDIGYGCGYRQQVKQIAEWVGFTYKDCGSSGWELDCTQWDEERMKKAGVDIV